MSQVKLSEAYANVMSPFALTYVLDWDVKEPKNCENMMRAVKGKSST